MAKERFTWTSCSDGKEMHQSKECDTRTESLLFSLLNLLLFNVFITVNEAKTTLLNIKAINSERITDYMLLTNLNC